MSNAQQIQITGSGINATTITSQDITVANTGGTTTVIDGNAITQTHSGGTTLYDHDQLSFSGANHSLVGLTANRTLTLQTNAGVMHFNTNNGGTHAWNIAATSGVLSSTLSTANIALTNNQTITTSGGANSTTLAPAQINLVASAINLAIFGNLFSAAGTNYTFQTTSLSNTITTRTIAGDINFSTNNGVTNHLQIRGSDGAILTTTLNAPFLRTTSQGAIAAGTVLPVSAGGTGYSVYKIPTRQRYSFTTDGAIQVFGLDADCKYFTVQLTGAGGGGGSSIDASSTGGGGGGGSYVYSLLPYTAAGLSVVIGRGGVGAAANSNNTGGTGAITTFRVSGVTLYTALGGIGGQGGSIGDWGLGGSSQEPLGPIDPAIDYYTGSTGGPGHDDIGGAGGAAAGPTAQTLQANDLSSPKIPGNGGAGRSNTLVGLNGSNGQCIITQYYQ